MKETLNESEIEEMESVTHFIKYVQTKPNVEAWEVWSAVSKLNELAKKVVSCPKKYNNKVLEKYACPLDNMKNILEQFIQIIYKELEKDDL